MIESIIIIWFNQIQTAFQQKLLERRKSLEMIKPLAVAKYDPERKGQDYLEALPPGQYGIWVLTQ